MEFFREGGQIQSGAVQKTGEHSGLSGPGLVGFSLVADMQGGVGGDACFSQSVSENAGVGLRGANLTGEGDGLETFAHSETLQYWVQAEVEVRKDVQGRQGGKAFERLGHVREEGPGFGSRKVSVEIVEERFDHRLWQGMANGRLECGFDDGLPPGAVVIGGRRRDGEEVGRVLLPRGSEAGFQNLGLQHEAVCFSPTRIGDADRFSQLEEGTCGVEKQALESHAGGRAPDYGVTLR